MSYWTIVRERFRYLLVKAGLFAMYCSLRIRIALGLYFDEEALQDFDLDVVHTSSLETEVE